ncbi:unnamed protein product [Amoebophrya sp. A25]|nr:unnamed protein product [Amoebophrya sp. A25]|eukprot:GSA25T00009877001.1
MSSSPRHLAARFRFGQTIGVAFFSAVSGFLLQYAPSECVSVRAWAGEVSWKVPLGVGLVYLAYALFTVYRLRSRQQGDAEKDAPQQSIKKDSKTKNEEHEATPASSSSHSKVDYSEEVACSSAPSRKSSISSNITTSTSSSDISDQSASSNSSDGKKLRAACEAGGGPGADADEESPHSEEKSRNSDVATSSKELLSQGTNATKNASSREALASTKATTEKGALEGFLLVYNLFQILFNGGWCIAVALHIMAEQQPLLGAPLLWGSPDGTVDAGGCAFASVYMTYLLWLHYANKLVEFADTFFMIQRGKAAQQLSFLHVYHHLLMVFAWWAVLHEWPGGDAWFGAWVNSLIHVLMYMYYFVAALGVRIPVSVKKAMTRCQLVQFVICFVHACLCWYLASVPRHVCGLQLYVMVNMLLLFSNFYSKSYTKNSPKTGGAPATTKST